MKETKQEIGDDSFKTIRNIGLSVMGLTVIFKLGVIILNHYRPFNNLVSPLENNCCTSSGLLFGSILFFADRLHGAK